MFVYMWARSLCNNNTIYLTMNFLTKFFQNKTMNVTRILLGFNIRRKIIENYQNNVAPDAKIIYQAFMIMKQEQNNLEYDRLFVLIPLVSYLGSSDHLNWKMQMFNITGGPIQLPAVNAYKNNKLFRYCYVMCTIKKFQLSSALLHVEIGPIFQPNKSIKTSFNLETKPPLPVQLAT